MKKMLISVLGWFGTLLMGLGTLRFVNVTYRDITNIVWVGSAILPFAIASLAIFIANHLGWNSPVELILVMQFFARLKASISNHIPPIVQDGLPAKKRSFRLLRPPIRVRLYLYTTSLICVLFAFVLEMIADIRGASILGHSLLNIVAYVFVSLAAICFIFNILLSALFFLRSVLLFLNGKG